MPGHICDLASVGKFAGTEQVQPTDGDMIGIEAARLPMPGQLKMKITQQAPPVVGVTIGMEAAPLPMPGR